ncbi:hypothetical protein KKB18_12300 [bacterium]|nr:hypothetical protein [bacterium]
MPEEGECYSPLHPQECTLVWIHRAVFTIGDKEQIISQISRRAKVIFSLIPVLLLLLIELSARIYFHYTEKTDEKAEFQPSYPVYPRADANSDPYKLRANFNYQFKVALPYIP